MFDWHNWLKCLLYSIGGLLTAVIIFIICVWVTLQYARAHDHWINKNRLTDPTTGEWCCNHIDCAEVEVNGVREVHGGYLISETGEVIPYQRIIWKSQDGAWWRCRNTSTNKTRCLIGPPPNG